MEEQMSPDADAFSQQAVCIADSVVAAGCPCDTMEYGIGSDQPTNQTSDDNSMEECGLQLHKV